MTDKKTIELANSISLTQLADIINIFSDRIDVYVGKATTLVSHINKVGGENHSKFYVTSKLSDEYPASLNGAFLQLNLEFVEHEEHEEQGDYPRYPARN